MLDRTLTLVGGWFRQQARQGTPEVSTERVSLRINHWELDFYLEFTRGRKGIRSSFYALYGAYGIATIVVVVYLIRT